MRFLVYVYNLPANRAGAQFPEGVIMEHESRSYNPKWNPVDGYLVASTTIALF